ncbi:MAG: EVE domain-containing protein [Actinomycetota bacterium]
MAYWLLKSEPDSFSIDDLEKVDSEPWDGVRNYQARNNLQAMKEGELAFFYHSNAKPPGVAGICEVVEEAKPDESQFDPGSKYHDPKATRDAPRWFCPRVRFVRRFERFVPLPEIREIPELSDMALVNRSRLSVQPVSEEHWKIICRMGDDA